MVSMAVGGEGNSLPHSLASQLPQLVDITTQPSPSLSVHPVHEFHSHTRGKLSHTHHIAPPPMGSAPIEALPH